MGSASARTFMAIALSMAVILLWQMYIAKTHTARVLDAGPSDTVSGVISPDVIDNSEAKERGHKYDDNQERGDAASDEKIGYEEKIAVLKNDFVEATFSNRGGRLRSLVLKKYKDHKNSNNYVDLVYNNAYPLALFLNNALHRFSENDRYEILERSDKRVLMRLEHPSGIIVTKEYTLLDKYEFLLNITIKNGNGKEFSFKPSLVWYDSALKGGKSEDEIRGVDGDYYYPICLANNAINSGEKINRERLSQSVEGQIGWSASNSRYFIASIIPVNQKVALCRFSSDARYNYTVSLIYPEFKIVSDGSTTFSYRLYLGPKGYSLLKGMGVGLERAVDFGWLAVLCIPLLYLLNLFYSVVHNYGIAIILLTIVIKVISIPFTQKSMKSMQELQKIKPKIDELQKKYKDNREKLNEEMMRLYREHGVSPFGGCLPMLLQMPIWFALYRMLSNSVELYQATFIPRWIDDLSAKDPYYILPVLLGVGTFLQQKITPSTMDSAQAKVLLYFMPVFLTVIMLSLPSGLTLYIFVSSLLSIIHQIYMNKTGSPNIQNRKAREEKR